MYCEKEFIGKKIKYFRKQKGLSQAELAEKVNLSDKHIGRIEAGRYFPNFINFLKILEVLDINLSEFGFEIKAENNSHKEELLRLIYSSNEKEVDTYLSIIKILRK